MMIGIRKPVSALGFALSFSILSVFPGCGNGPGGLSSQLVPGTYEGDVDSTARLFADGQEVGQPIRNTFRTQETINANGIPLLTTGKPISSGDVIVLAEAGSNILFGTVRSVVPEGDGLLLNFDVDGDIDGIPVIGTGTTAYDMRNDGSIGLDMSLDWAGVDPAGRIVRQTEERSGVLSPTA